MTPVKVGIIMGSDSDLPVMKGACDILDKFGLEYEVVIASAHRVPQIVAKFAAEAREKGFRVLIAGAGLAAHLPGVVAAYTTLPVIGVPIKGGALNGIDALYSIVQMPTGIPVATVAINGAQNAGILAAQIIGTADEVVAGKLQAYKEEMAGNVNQKAARLKELGVERFLAEHGRS